MERGGTGTRTKKIRVRLSLLLLVLVLELAFSDDYFFLEIFAGKLTQVSFNCDALTFTLFL